jgi:PAS domain S-box-containing protein
MKQDPLRLPSDDQFKLTANQLPVLIWLCDRDNSYCFFNSAWLTFTGRHADQPGNVWTESVKSEDLRHNLEHYSEAIEARVAFQRIYRLKRHDGVYRWIAEQCQPKYHADGSFAGYAGYGVDVGELLEDPRLDGNVAGAESAQRERNLNEELAATNEELSAANEEMIATNEELRQSQQNLADLNRELETLVEARTRALSESQEELATANEELAASNEELMTMNEELEVSRQEILKREKLFKSIAENIPKSVVVVVGKDERFLAIEGDLVVKMGFNGQDYIGKHPSEVVPPERYKASKHLYERVLAGEQFSVDRKGQNGEDYRVELVPLRNDANEIYAAMILALDITDIKQAEERSAKLAAIVTNSDDAIVSKTLDGIVTSWNASAERMFGYTEKEMIGQPLLKIVPEGKYDEESRILEQLRKGHRVDHFETIRKTKDGRLLDVSLTVSPVRDSEGNITGASNITRDISEKKRDEQRKNDFISMVSHELKTPLTSLTAIVQLLQVKLENNVDPFTVNSLKNANKQVKKMADIINGFLNISRLEAGKMPMVKQEFMLNELVKEAIEETQITGASNVVHFHEDGQVAIKADRDKIASVILNLLNNAVKYSAKNSTVDVYCRIVGDKAQVSVKDRGIGIAASDTKKLFDRFYRVENEETQHISGFGIGLYLSAEIIRQHQGQIWVESKPGKGSEFYFTLPLN